MAARRIFLAGLYGVQNLGDHAIRDTVEAAAPGAGAEVHRYTTRRPSRDRRTVHVRGPGLPRYVYEAARADRIVIGGGGLLKDEAIGFSLELWATALIGRLMRREVRLLAVGAGPIYTRFGRRVIAATARLAQVRTVRDRESAELLRELGVASVEVCADPMFSSTAAAADASGPAVPSVPVLFALRPWFHTDPDGGTSRWPGFRQQVATLLSRLERDERGYRLACLYWPEDRDTADELLQAAGAESGFSVSDTPPGWGDMLREAASAERVVAMRYHALAAAAIMGRPVIALPYEPKVRSLATELGVPMVEVDDPQLADRLVELLGADPADLLPRPGVVEDLRDRADRALSLALGA